MRINEFKEYLNSNDIDYALFSSNNIDNLDYNFLYFSGFDTGILLIDKNNAKLFVSEMEYPRAIKESRIKNIIPVKNSVFEHISKIKAKKVGLNYDKISLKSRSNISKYLKKVKFVDISNECDELRSIKTKDEINYIKKACNYTDKIYDNILSNFNFKTELELYNNILSLIRDYGLNESFSPIVANAKNSGIAHSNASKNKLRKGFLVLDFGVKYKNYCSDLTRTVYIGKPSKKEIDDYNLVLDSQLKAIDMLECDKNVSEIDNFIRKKLGKRFIHSSGHGIGLRIHESPSISFKSKEIFKENMTFTIEPGVYSNKYGIRIEDDILLRKDKIEILTKSNKELNDI